MSIVAAPAWLDGPTEGRGELPPLCPRCASGVLADIDERPQISRPEDAAGLLLHELAGRDRERCVVLHLDTKHRLIDASTASIGSIDHTFMAPRELLRDALLSNAAAIVLAHNHPSGDPEPSRDDEAVTRRLVGAAELVGITVLDHLVVGGTRWVSIARRGLL